jgi:hypothetical protein
MLARFQKAWGPRDANPQRWAAHGVCQYLTKDASPMFLNTSDAESAEYRDGLEKLAKRLQTLGIEHVYRVDADQRGHRVSTDRKTLSAIYSFMERYLRSNQGGVPAGDGAPVRNLNTPNRKGGRADHDE